MSDRSNVTPLSAQPTICALCGLAGHTASVCPDRPGDAMAVELLEAA